MLKRIRKATIIISTSIVTLSVVSCGSDNSGEKKAGNTDTAVSDNKRIDSLSATKKSKIDFKFATAVANMPSPFEVILDVTSTQVPYKSDLLNPASNAEYYITPYKKAVNLGAYGIDLAYINFYGKYADMLTDFNTIQGISKDLNINALFDQFAERFKTNSNNKDSIIKILDDLYDKTDAYLKKNANYLVASHILAGAVIETNYLSINLVKGTAQTKDNAAFFEKIFNENLFIYELINLFGEYTDKDSKELLTEMKMYRDSYNAVIKSATDLTPENMEKASKLITGLRNNMVKK